jgi:DNA modification methylase
LSKAKIIIGDVRTAMQSIPDGSVQTCITSPPYWGLRDYGTGAWTGGDNQCSHKRDSKYSDKTITGHKNPAIGGVGDAIYKSICERCGAIRKDEQLGLESTPQEYVDEMVEVFREVWRVLKDDGTLWLNIGDTYASFKDGKSVPDSLRTNDDTAVSSSPSRNPANLKRAGLKSKDMVGIPWMLAFALRADGWYLRQDIIWAKPNPMPESVTDRCTKSHEYVFLLSKNERYYYDNEAIKEPAVTPIDTKAGQAFKAPGGKARENYGTNEDNWEPDGLRNKRDVWNITTKPFKGAHFAVMPEALVEPCIFAGSSVGDTVLDPFTGSGTVGMVALRHNRNFIGTELNPEYAELAVNRIYNDGPLFNEVQKELANG